jgi:hypothetical protein
MKKGMAADDFAKAYRVPDNYKGFRADPAASNGQRQGDLGGEQAIAACTGRYQGADRCSFWRM